MRKGFVRISPELIQDAMKFPPDWKIENMNTMIENGLPVIHAIISGSDFPEEPELEGVPIKECRIIIHKERLTYEVKETLKDIAKTEPPIGIDGEPINVNLGYKCVS